MHLPSKQKRLFTDSKSIISDESLSTNLCSTEDNSDVDKLEFTGNLRGNNNSFTGKIGLGNREELPSKPVSSGKFDNFEKSSSDENLEYFKVSLSQIHGGNQLRQIPYFDSTPHKQHPKNVLLNPNTQSKIPPSTSIKAQDTHPLPNKKSQESSSNPKVSRSVRAADAELTNRKIDAKPNGFVAPDKIYKFRISCQDGIQVPAVRLHRTPVSLSNWTNSWQEMFCYNPRKYDLTSEFLENYTVIRGIFEDYITKMTDIVFHVSAIPKSNKPKIGHAYLIPPIYPHKYSTATCLQCYTSDDEWLAKGAWERISKVDSQSGIIMDKMMPCNLKQSPYFPFITAGSASKRGCEASQKAKIDKSQTHLPLHLWIILGGKDMMALDGIPLVWKFLRWASEIPPSEFWESSERNLAKDGGSASNGSWWQEQPPSEVYKLFHKKDSKSFNTKSNPNIPFNVTPNSKQDMNYNHFGPWIYDLEGIEGKKLYKCAFLLVDYPGYGNSTGSPEPLSIRATVFKAFKEALKELSEYHDVENIVVNVFGYSLGCAVALNFVCDLAQAILFDYANEKNAQASNSKIDHKSNSSVYSSTDCSSAYNSSESSIEYSSSAHYHRSDRKNAYDNNPPFLTLRDLGEMQFENHSLYWRNFDKIKNFANNRAYIEIKKIKIKVNRIILISPFSSTQAMAKKITQEKVGSILSSALSCLVSQSIDWDNLKVVNKFFSNLSEMEKLKMDTFQDLRIYIQHGEKDNLINWSMSSELAREMSAARAKYNLKMLIQLYLLPNQDHISILLGMSELQMIEICFAPYRLHPCSPLATQKYYRKKFNIVPKPNALRSY